MKWGNSLAIRLPAHLNFTEGDVVVLEEIGNMVLLRKENDNDVPRSELTKIAIDLLLETLK